MSSLTHRIGRMHWTDLQLEDRYNKWTAYGRTKLANLLFTLELDRQARAAHTGLVATAAHPGYSATNLTHGGSTLGRRRFMDPLMQLGDRILAQSDEQGAFPQLHAATAPGVAGNDYFAPDGPLEGRGARIRHGRRTRTARNTGAARLLWTVSEDLTGVRYAWPTRGVA